ncbi:MAG: single-stranded-DNA-specific exonuclease RecJ [Pseudomonadota bacterium]
MTAPILSEKPLSSDNFLDVSTSLSGRHWMMKPYDETLARKLSAKLAGDDLLGRLLAGRGVDPEAVDGFLAPTLRDTFPDPSSFADMDKAAEIILTALLEGHRVTVFADYDVDGGTASAILTRYFRAWGRDLGLYVPDRLTEGYGPSPAAFQHLKSTGQDLVITVDCGAAAREALEEAVRIDLPVIVLDHHLMQGDLPPCTALVNPNRPDCPSGAGHLAGAGVAFVFIAAVNRLARERGVHPDSGELPDPMQWLDLCALGTLCDMAPLKSFNRAFAIQGLKVMAQNRNPGLRALADVSGIGEINSVYQATFMLGPRLNAGGRISDPWLAAKLLATDDRREAVEIAERLHAVNDERKAMESRILEAATVQAEKMLAAQPDLPVIVASGEGWHPGVIGIVAGRLKDKFHLPSIVIGWGEGLGPVAKGSARSVAGINIGEAIAEAAREGFLLSGGGHAMAGGLSVEPDGIQSFADWLTVRLKGSGHELEAARSLTIDAVLGAGAVSVETYQSISRIGPFGAGAPEPVFAICDASIVDSRAIGENHMKFTIEETGRRVECLAWRARDTALGDAIIAGASMHLAGRLKLNEWNGRKRAQFEVADAALA